LTAGSRDPGSDATPPDLAPNLRWDYVLAANEMDEAIGLALSCEQCRAV